MEKVHLTNQEIIIKFEDHIEKIKTFCKLYDEGDINICEEIAVKLRVLFHSTNRSKSLFQTAKMENTMFVDTASKFDPKNLVSSIGLIALVQNNDGKAFYKAVMNMHGRRFVNYENWWKNKKVICDKHKNTFTRKDIICHVADTDGGAHVDDSIFKDYYELSRNNSLDWKYFRNGTNYNFANPVPECIRQIAYEVIETYKEVDLRELSKLHF